MIVDVEQIKRDAEAVQPDKTRFTARTVLALLAEIDRLKAVGPKLPESMSARSALASRLVEQHRQGPA